MEMTRRSFLVAASGSAVPIVAQPGPARASQGAAAALSAGDVVQRIKDRVGVPWNAETVDNMIAGAPDTPVRGIATTMMATLEVLQKAAGAGLNLVITHEPTFYSHQDRIDDLRDDETYRYKADFIRQHQMAVFHFHDHWHRRKPDGIAVGMARELGWERFKTADSEREFVFPKRPLAELAKDIDSRLKPRTMRILGDPQLIVTRAIARWGYFSQVSGPPHIARPDVDVLIVGETREWELVEYVQDQIASGKKKGLIVIGHVVSEQAGMKLCAEWLKSFVSEVPIDFVPASDPFWTV